MVWVITRLAAVLGDGLGRCFAIRAVPPALPARAVGGAHVLLDDALEVLGDAVTLQRDGLLAIHVDGRDRPLAGARQADADVRLLGFAGAVDDATHDGDVHGLDARITLAPPGHLGAEVALDSRRELLEESAGRPPAARAGDHERREGAQPHGL